MPRKPMSNPEFEEFTANDFSAPLSSQLFQGTFDAKKRELFHAKRLAVGFSLQQLGDFLKIHWSTIRKWEAGVTTNCHPRHIKRINKFLSGDYDEQLQTLGRQELYPKPVAVHQVPLAVDQCLERASQAYQLCQTDYPDLGDAFLASIDQAIQETIRGFLDRLEHPDHDLGKN